MSPSKQAWSIGVIGGTVAAILGGIAVFHYQNWWSSKTIEISKIESREPVQKPAAIAISTEPHQLPCLTALDTRIDAIAGLQYRMDQDAGYFKILDELLACKEFDKAVPIVLKLQYGTDQDVYFKKIIEGAMLNHDFVLARASISKLRFRFEQDDYLKRLLSDVQGPK